MRLCLVLEIRTVTLSKSPCKNLWVPVKGSLRLMWSEKTMYRLQKICCWSYFWQLCTLLYILIPFTNLQYLNFNVIVLFTDLSHTQQELYFSFSNANVSIDLDNTVAEELKRGIVSTGVFFKAPFVKTLVYYMGNVNHMHDKNSFFLFFTQWTIAKQSNWKRKKLYITNYV